jgi:hypothetical protein
VCELVGVEDRPNGDDHAVRDLECGDPERASVYVV